MSEEERLEVVLGKNGGAGGQRWRRRASKVAGEGLWEMKWCRDELVGVSTK